MWVHLRPKRNAQCVEWLFPAFSASCPMLTITLNFNSLPGSCLRPNVRLVHSFVNPCGSDRFCPCSTSVRCGTLTSANRHWGASRRGMLLSNAKQDGMGGETSPCISRRPARSGRRVLSATGRQLPCGLAQIPWKQACASVGERWEVRGGAEALPCHAAGVLEWKWHVFWGRHCSGVPRVCVTCSAEAPGARADTATSLP